jgi:hypothetical protein
VRLLGTLRVLLLLLLLLLLGVHQATITLHYSIADFEGTCVKRQAYCTTALLRPTLCRPGRIAGCSCTVSSAYCWHAFLHHQNPAALHHYVLCQRTELHHGNTLLAALQTHCTGAQLNCTSALYQSTVDLQFPAPTMHTSPEHRWKDLPCSIRLLSLSLTGIHWAERSVLGPPVPEATSTNLPSATATVTAAKLTAAELPAKARESMDSALATWDRDLEMEPMGIPPTYATPAAWTFCNEIASKLPAEIVNEITDELMNEIVDEIVDEIAFTRGETRVECPPRTQRMEAEAAAGLALDAASLCCLQGGDEVARLVEGVASRASTAQEAAAGLAPAPAAAEPAASAEGSAADEVAAGALPAAAAVRCGSWAGDWLARMLRAAPAAAGHAPSHHGHIVPQHCCMCTPIGHACNHAVPEHPTMCRSSTTALLCRSSTTALLCPTLCSSTRAALQACMHACGGREQVRPCI